MNQRPHPQQLAFDQLREIAALIERLPHVDLHGDKGIQFDQPLIVPLEGSVQDLHVFAVSYDEDEDEVTWMDEQQAWDNLHPIFQPDATLIPAILHHLKGLEVSMAPTYIRNP